MTNSEITLFRYDEAADEYLNIGTFEAWVHKKDRLHRDGDGETERDCFAVRISADKVSKILIGDRIFFGASTERVSSEKCKTVSWVKDNRFGTQPHWAIEAEYRYI